MVEATGNISPWAILGKLIRVYIHCCCYFSFPTTRQTLFVSAANSFLVDTLINKIGGVIDIFSVLPLLKYMLVSLFHPLH